MFCGNNLISVLNTKTSKAATLTIDDFWKSVMEKSKDVDSAAVDLLGLIAKTIDLSDDEYMIRDGGGYTRIESIMYIKQMLNRGKYYKIESNGNSMFLDMDAMIYVFDTNEEPTIGFHGIRNYKRKEKILGHYVYANKFKFQVYRLSEDNSLMENFESAEISEFKERQIEYAIVTKSHTLNCNGFFVPDSDAIFKSMDMLKEVISQ